ncbi:NAD(P)H-hydrate dehydratase [Microvirgula aerodenitrificans]|uniref:NAD(P)H-hydrate dehydratase n=1 Tax=Microvirgula aerodenitrificans TaxID=57480 RepID=UPI00131F0651|nr:NAD(P)H-hydrate dehydratase [Microvirgula aerodenitrificans]
MAIGPGLGQSPAAAQLLRDTLQRGGPLVLDADALNLIAADAGLADLCRTRGAATVITPHPAEAARLLGTSTEAVQSDRIAAVRQLASRLNAVALLKGCGTLVAGPDGFFTVNPTGHPGLAQAGQGDTLTGMIAALLAQGLSAGQAARHGAWLHGQTAGSIVAQSTRR